MAMDAADIAWDTWGSLLALPSVMVTADVVHVDFDTGRIHVNANAEWECPNCLTKQVVSWADTILRQEQPVFVEQVCPTCKTHSSIHTQWELM